MYQEVRKILEEYGFEGTTWSTLLERTDLDSAQLYQTIGQGFKTGGTEMFVKDNIQYYRNRPKGRKLYPKDELKL